MINLCLTFPVTEANNNITFTDGQIMDYCSFSTNILQRQIANRMSYQSDTLLPSDSLSETPHARIYSEHLIVGNNSTGHYFPKALHKIQTHASICYLYNLPLVFDHVTLKLSYLFQYTNTQMRENLKLYLYKINSRSYCFRTRLTKSILPLKSIYFFIRLTFIYLPLRLSRRV